ncbi:CHAT domain-containing protein [Maribellus comscasis]|uniref:CHAT domain-containing protein n=1 Tax=Maribellus comscasis TaxID=2681766 RepID=A0A6I6K537_9BACT|nr:CHAT domain-containing tetratricopeptide repeat protein [Maribellus comscasis]QGY46733.1 CHAT domain-containing protein [Maribellus comscasis]
MNKLFIVLIFSTLTLSPIYLFGIDLNNENDSIQAVQLFSVASEYSYTGQYYEALEAFKDALELRKKFYGENSNRLAGTYMALGTTYKNIGKYDLAEQNVLIAERLYKDRYGANSSRISNVYFNIGNIYRAKLNYAEAIRYFEQSITIIKSQEVVDHVLIAYINYSIAEIYYLMERYDKAIEIIKSNIDNSETIDKIYYYELLGAIYNTEKKYDLASIAYEKAIKYTLEFYPTNDINIAFQYLNYASFQYNINNYEVAEDYLKKAYSIISLTETQTGTTIAEYYRIYGFLNAGKKINTTDVEDFRNQKYQNYQQAIFYFKKALKAYNFPPDPESITSLDEINSISIVSSISILKFIADNYVEMALIYEGNNKDIYKKSIDRALDYYGFVGDLLQKTKREISDDDSRILLAGLEQSTLIKLIETSFRAYKLENSVEYVELAFKNAESLKSGSLFDKLSNDEAMQSSLIPDSLLTLERKINLNITNFSSMKYNEQVSETPDVSEINRLDSVLFSLRRQRTELNDYLEDNYKQYYSLKYSDNSININKIQDKLKSDEVLVEYVLNEMDSLTELYTFFFTNNEVQFERQELAPSFSKNIDEIFQFMSNSGYIFTKNEDSKKYCVASNQLYKNLIAPYENKIKDKNLIIVPDGKLSYISFDALLTDLPDTTSTIQFNKLDYLIKSNIINYSYSANLIYNIDNTKTNSQKRILAFAPEYNSDSITIGNSVFPLRPLIGTQKEVDLIASEIKTEVYKGENATELKFREKSEDYDILHLAMHAFINDSLPSLSQFAFAQNKNGNLSSDGLLSTADIYNLNLKARLSVLSACNTGTGQLKKGEGVISLARGFLYAGCPAIIMTLWEVEDNSGTKIMSSFYKFLKKGKNKDEALRLAKLEYLENANSRLAHPHYWLGYVSIGDNTSLYKSYDFYFFSLLLLTIIGVTAEQIIRIRKARKKRA